ncbi:hypothetical protein [Rhizobacter sp. P5_C2]
MKTPEQLPLNFSASPFDRANSNEPASADVVNLGAVRAARHDQRMSAVYDAIRESIRHIDVRRASTGRDFEDSSYG